MPAHAKGADLRLLLTDPKAKWDLPGITTFHQNNHAVRTEQFRYIHYNGTDGEELYDHTKDEYEWTNLAANPAYAAQKAELIKLLPKENAPELPRTGGGEEGEPKKKAKAKKQ